MTKLKAKINAEIIEEAIPAPEGTARGVLGCPFMGKHPLPYGDPRVRGFMVELGTAPAHQERLARDARALAGLLREFRRPDCNLFTLAVNQYPPTRADSFLLKPHVDRRRVAP